MAAPSVSDGGKRLDVVDCRHESNAELLVFGREPTNLPLPHTLKVKGVGTCSSHTLVVFE